MLTRERRELNGNGSNFQVNNEMANIDEYKFYDNCKLIFELLKWKYAMILFQISFNILAVLQLLGPQDQLSTVRFNSHSSANTMWMRLQSPVSSYEVTLAFESFEMTTVRNRGTRCRVAAR